MDDFLFGQMVPMSSGLIFYPKPKLGIGELPMELNRKKYELHLPVLNLIQYQSISLTL